MLGTAVSVISDLLDCRAACLCYDETGTGKTFLQRTEEGKFVRRRLENGEEVKKGWKTSRILSMREEFYDWRYGGEGILGVCVSPEKSGGFEETQKIFLHSSWNAWRWLDRILAVRKQVRPASLRNDTGQPAPGDFTI